MNTNPDNTPKAYGVMARIAEVRPNLLTESQAAGEAIWNDCGSIQQQSEINMGPIKILLAWLVVVLVWSLEVVYLLPHFETTDFFTFLLSLGSLFVCAAVTIGAFFITVHETMPNAG
jgi:hypothetical protein